MTEQLSFRETRRDADRLEWLDQVIRDGVWVFSTGNGSIAVIPRDGVGGSFGADLREAVDDAMDAREPDTSEERNE